MSTLLWLLLGVILAFLCLTALIALGVATLRKGHTVLFFVGIVFPLLWIIGALMGPAPKMSTHEARLRLRMASLRDTPR